MAATRKGGLKAVLTNKDKYGPDHYRNIAKLAHQSWVRNGRKPRGFSLDHERASRAGTVSRRKRKKVVE